MKLFKLGDKVVHDRHGEGEILRVDDGDDDYLVGFYNPSERLHCARNSKINIDSKFHSKCWYVKHVYPGLQLIKPRKIPSGCVYVLLEHHTKVSDAYVHGVYTSREAANKARDRLHSTIHYGYLAVIKKRVKGEPRND